ncbi:rRNA (cytidine-2'-O-)-methyltransferase, partial [Frankia sp. Cpl3]|nr:rRNA (cytidine-2'-O-)-methyltransferase [Frankia sp. Cpl3]
LLFYEAPHRIVKTLEAMKEAWGEREAVLARELTKRYEEFARGTFSELLRWLEEGEPRGEFCLLVSGRSKAEAQQEAEAASLWWQQLSIVEHVDRYCEQGMNTKEAVKQAAEDRSLPKRDVYNEYHRA